MAEEEDEAAHVPFIQDDETPGSNYEQTSNLQESKLTAPSSFIWALTLAAGISGLLFGYEYAHLFLPSEVLLTSLQHWCHILNFGVDRS